jgi:hypothetical protein
MPAVQPVVIPTKSSIHVSSNYDMHVGCWLWGGKVGRRLAEGVNT